MTLINKALKVVELYGENTVATSFAKEVIDKETSPVKIETFSPDKDTYSKMYIAVLDEVPAFMVPTLVAHAVLGAHLYFEDNYKNFSEKAVYLEWLYNSFRKCVVRVNRKEFNKIKELGNVYLAHENTTLNGEKSCAIPLPVDSGSMPKVLKFAKLWTPGGNKKQLEWKEDNSSYSVETCLGTFVISKLTGHATLHAFGAKPKMWYKKEGDDAKDQLSELKQRIEKAHDIQLITLKKWF